MSHSIEWLRRQAKDLLKAARNDEPCAVERVLRYHPRWHKFWRSRVGIRLADAQLVLARENSFSTWLQLKDWIMQGGLIEAEIPGQENPYFAVVDNISRKSERIRWSTILSARPGKFSLANRGQPLPPQKLDALIRGLSHSNPVVRRTCLEILDQHPHLSAIPHIMQRVDDAVPRVRWHALHALSCDACKGGESFKSQATLARIGKVAANDPNPKVRAYAQEILASSCTTP